MTTVSIEELARNVSGVVSEVAKTGRSAVITRYGGPLAAVVPIATYDPRQLALLSQVERIVGLGSWEWKPETDELVWSDNHFRLFGLEPGEIVPSRDFVIGRTHPDDRRRVELAVEALSAGEFRRPVLEYRIVRTDGTITSLSMTLGVVEDEPSLPRRIVGSVQDVTLARRLDRQLAAHLAVTRALDDWTSLAQGAEDLLGGLAEAMDFVFGAFWVPDGAYFVARAIWRTPASVLDPVTETTLRWHPGVGSASIGSAFTSREPVILRDAAEGGPSPRNAALRRAGVEGAMAVPVVSVDETLAVLEFLSLEPTVPTERLIRTLQGIGHEVGHFLSHRRGELIAPVLTPRELEVLQLAARGLSAAMIAAELYLSPATVKRHFERAYASLGVADRAAAVGEAMRRGLIT